eukprot:11157551-Lingulodinium_polyedra.AAC.1
MRCEGPLGPACFGEHLAAWKAVAARGALDSLRSGGPQPVARVLRGGRPGRRPRCRPARSGAVVGLPLRC